MKPPPLSPLKRNHKTDGKRFPDVSFPSFQQYSSQSLFYTMGGGRNSKPGVAHLLKEYIPARTKGSHSHAPVQDSRPKIEKPISVEITET